MTLIILGLALWFALHFMPVLKPRFRSKLIKTLKPALYASGFSLGLIAAITLMSLGWRSMQPFNLYQLPTWTALPGMALVLAGVVLFGFGFIRTLATNLKRPVRHLQLTGMACWATGHLVLNGDNRSVLLFGGLLLWALAMIFFINKRDGQWIRPQAVPLRTELLPAAIALAFVLGFVFGHPWLSGKALLIL